MPPAAPATAEKPKDLAPPELIPETCEWARWNWQNALDGLRAVSAGVKSYKIGTRFTEYHTVAEQSAIVDYWRKMVELYCGIAPLPSAITGRDTACRIIPRDV
jgi:hypothetical protein